MSPSGGKRELDSHLIVRVSTALKEAIEKLAAMDRRGLSDYIRLALEAHVEAKRRRK